MPIITFANNKGGSGKSTSALILAGEIAEKNSVVIIDADPRRPIAKWATLVPLPTTLTVLKSKGENHIQDEIDQAARKSSFVVVDLEGTASKLASFAMSESDLVIVPAQEQQQDAEAALETLAEIKRAGRAARRVIRSSIVFTKSKAAVKGRTARGINVQIRGHEEIDVLSVELVERDAFAALFAVGGTLRQLTVAEVPGLLKAIENADAFAYEVLKRLQPSDENRAYSND